MPSSLLLDALELDDWKDPGQRSFDGQLPFVLVRPRAFAQSFVWRVGGRARQLEERLAGKRRGACKKIYLLSLSMSAGVTYVVPEIHCRLDIVGRGGIKASGLKSLSNDRVLGSSQ